MKRCFRIRVRAAVGHGLVLSAALVLSSCQSSHGNEVSVSRNDCVVCHLPDYQATTTPAHDGLFPTTCGDCHTQSEWIPAKAFNHEWFPLENAHAEVACATCHVNGYEPGATPNTCVGCHLDDYNSSTFPGHQDFPTTCENCHTTVAWKPANGGNHPENAFPIERGAHSGIVCLDCHNNSLPAPFNTPIMGANADCVGCHTGEHALSSMNGKHSDVSQYTNYRDNPPTGYAQHNFCLICHPNGGGGD
ncbi:MAG: hypothetical protein IPJ88_09995 [Myxococcales bacterium]|nr:MAG: hypothetical protein IPJ88_09995 [Myxococcales bacterium]